MTSNHLHSYADLHHMQSRLFLCAAVVAVGSVLGWLTASGRHNDLLAHDSKAQSAGDGTKTFDRTVLPIASPAFTGQIGKTYKDSKEAWPVLPSAPKGAPNVVVIMLDDVGYGQTSTFGGPVPTPPLADTLKHLDEIGGANTEPQYPVGWAWCGNTPFQWVKQVASHLGGARNPMVVSWPARIKDKGGSRDQFVHLIDVVPTIPSGLPAPKSVDGVEQKPMDGCRSSRRSTRRTHNPSASVNTSKCYSNRAIYDDGWMARAQHTFPWRQDFAPGNWEKDKWELYNLKEDYSEANDLAAKMPDKLAQMKSSSTARPKSTASTRSTIAGQAGSSRRNRRHRTRPASPSRSSSGRRGWQRPPHQT